MNIATKIGKDSNGESLIVPRSIAEVRVVSIDVATMATEEITQNIGDKSEILKPCLNWVLRE